MLSSFVAYPMCCHVSAAQIPRLEQFRFVHYPRGNAFSGTIKRVQIDIDAAAKDADHMLGAEERFQLALARQ